MINENCLAVTHRRNGSSGVVLYTLGSNKEKSFQDCTQHLDGYFIAKANVAFERHLFREREQLPGETVDQFVCRHRQKAQSCEFSYVKEAIHD